MTNAEFHALCDEHWRGRMPAKGSQEGFAWIESLAVHDGWRRDKEWIDNGCVLVGNFNGDGEYPDPPTWWPANA